MLGGSTPLPRRESPVVVLFALDTPAHRIAFVTARLIRAFCHTPQLWGLCPNLYRRPSVQPRHTASNSAIPSAVPQENDEAPGVSGGRQSVPNRFLRIAKLRMPRESCVKTMRGWDSGRKPAVGPRVWSRRSPERGIARPGMPQLRLPDVPGSELLLSPSDWHRV